MVSEPQRTIVQNFTSWRERWGLTAPIEQTSVLVDRIFFYDPELELLDFALRCGWDVSEPRNHGASVILSMREIAAPSCQFCVHRQRSAITGKIRLMYEVDFDYAPPLLHKPRFFMVHAGEVFLNCVLRTKTDQDKVWADMRAYWATPAGGGLLIPA